MQHIEIIVLFLTLVFYIHTFCHVKHNNKHLWEPVEIEENTISINGCTILIVMKHVNENMIISNEKYNKIKIQSTGVIQHMRNV